MMQRSRHEKPMPDQIAATGSSAPGYRAIEMLGVRIDDVTMSATLAWADASVRQGAPRDNAPRQIATVNIEFLMAARRNAAFREVLNAAALCIPDSVGILWGARLLGYRLRERVAGSDLTGELAALAAQRGYRLFLLGAAPGVAELAASRLVQTWPQLQIAGTYAGSPAVAEEIEIAARIRDAGAQILLVAYGAPQQDLWIARNIEKTGAALAMGVGGSLDFIAGVATRAPKRWQRLGLEWLYRLYRQPWRWRRMLALPHCALLVLAQRVRRGRAQPIVRRIEA
jgi:N-acetylglucosaminyldiphosphoundecaprenol N-acetyl-beta-D-mannosaminyltransferase